MSCSPSSDRSQPLLDSSPDRSPPESPFVLNLSAASSRWLYLSFLLLGFGAVLPTYVIFAAVDYFNDALPGADIEFSLNVVFNGTLFAMSICNCLFFTKHGFTVRIIGGFGAIGACMAALPVIDLLRPVAPLFDRAFEPLVVLIAALLGTADAFAQASIFGLASAAFPPLYTKALMFGISICGTSITLARVGCKLLLDDVRASSYLFFALAALYSISTAALFVHLRLRHSLFRRHLHAATSTSPTLARRAIERSPPGSKERDSLKPAASLSFSRQAGALLSSRAVLEPCAILAILNAQQSVIVPSILALSQDFLGQGWFHVLAVLAFNVGDMLGRGPLAGYCPCPMRFVWPAVGARFAVCAAICACVPPYALSEEPLPLLLLGCTLGLTTGHLATSVIATASTRVPAEGRESVGYLTILAIFVGLMAGSLAAIPLKHALEGAA
mmetsp:Transcript_23408/g.61847  ORF Transcript_23408/g.61847 Transcript_23408/m.61847 type:complete len:443 (+) Transcript_23408:31-1359(+)